MNRRIDFMILDIKEKWLLGWCFGTIKMITKSFKIKWVRKSLCFMGGCG
jgi:hypothetical protein